MIFKAAYDLPKEAARDLLDVSLPGGDVEWIPGYVTDNWPAVRSFHRLRTRKAGSNRFIDIHLAFSRTPGQPRKYVQDAMRERAADLAQMIADPDSHFYVCGLKSMEDGVVLALKEIATQAGLNWDSVGASLKREGRLHLETY